MNLPLILIEVPQSQHDLHLDPIGLSVSLVPLEPSYLFRDLCAFFDLLGENGQRKDLNNHDYY